MKKYILIQAICLSVFALLQYGCEKDRPVPQAQQPLPPIPPPTPPPPPPPPPPTPPPPYFITFAGFDISIESTGDSALLIGKMNGGGVGNTFRYRWEKFNGPNGGIIQKPDSLRTVLKNLEPGVYTYVLRITDQAAVEDTDTITLVVNNPSSAIRKISFLNVEWECPFGCGILLEEVDFYTGSRPIEIFIRRDFSTIWEKVYDILSGVPGRYFYETSTPPYIQIWEEPDVTVFDKPDIKIEF